MEKGSFSSKSEEDISVTSTKSWADAPEFVPRLQQSSTYPGVQSSSTQPPQPLQNVTQKRRFVLPSGRLGSSAPGFSEIGSSAPSFSGIGSSAQSFSGIGSSAPSFSGIGSSAPSLSGIGSSAPSFSGIGSSATSFGGIESSTPSVSGIGSSAPSFSGIGSSAPSFSGIGSSAPSFSGVGSSAQSFSGIGPNAPSFSGIGSSVPCFSGGPTGDVQSFSAVTQPNITTQVELLHSQRERHLARHPGRGGTGSKQGACDSQGSVDRPSKGYSYRYQSWWESGAQVDQPLGQIVAGSHSTSAVPSKRQKDRAYVKTEKVSLKDQVASSTSDSNSSRDSCLPTKKKMQHRKQAVHQWIRTS